MSLAITEILIFKRGHTLPLPLLGGGEKVLVQHSKTMSKIGLNPENHVSSSSSNSMAITEISLFNV